MELKLINRWVRKASIVITRLIKRDCFPFVLLRASAHPLGMTFFINRSNLLPLSILVGLMVLFSPWCSTGWCGVEVLFSPRDNINYRIIEAVDLSEACIDVSAFDFTSKEIADALVDARRKGLKIRLLVDKKLLEDEDNDSQVKHLEEIGFDIKALRGKGKGSMKNSFIIFDSRLVIVGPYHLIEDKESYNYENAIFFDDRGVVETYQNEFDRLFGKRNTLKTSPKKVEEDSLLSTIIKPSSLPERSTQSGSLLQKPVSNGHTSLKDSARAEPTIDAQPSAEEHVAPSEVKIAAVDKEALTSEKLPVSTKDSSGFRLPLSDIKNTPAPATEQKALETQPASLGSEDTTQTAGYTDATALDNIGPPPIPGSVIDISFEELDKIFGQESALSSIEKNSLWVSYMGRYVKWTGDVTYTLLGFIKGTRIGFRHKQGSDNDVEVRFSIKRALKVMKIAEGDTLTYTAKLLSLPTPDTPYYVLSEGILD